MPPEQKSQTKQKQDARTFMIFKVVAMQRFPPAESPETATVSAVVLSTEALESAHAYA